MTTVFTDFFRGQLYASLDKTVPIDPTQSLMNGKSVYWVFFRSYAAFADENDPRYTGIETVSDLASIPGWGTPLSPATPAQAVGTTTAGTVTYCIANNPFAMGGGWAASTVKAAALVLVGSYAGQTDPIIYLTDDPFDEGKVMNPADSLIARPVSAVGGNRPLFSWPVFIPGATQSVPTPGSIALLPAPPTFELAYTQHAWLYPQRVNFVANPSFEAPGTSYWRTNGAVARVQSTTGTPSAPGGGAWFGRFSGGGTVVAESNQFPLTTRVMQDSWTIQAMVRGTGQLRVGLLSWAEDFLETGADWGDSQVWDLPANGFLHVYARRFSGENSTGQVRFECSGGLMEIDNVLCEPDWLDQWPYFDGDSTYGARDDYSWYGGENRKGATYSLFYNHKRAVTGRLFAWDIAADDYVITDEEVEAQGFVYKWVPAGVRVTPHLDVLYPGDIQEAIAPLSGPVTPYKTGPNDLLGVTKPWPSAGQYLNPTVGTVTTPNMGALPTQSVWVFKVRGPSAGVYGSIASESTNTAPISLSWNLRRADTSINRFNTILYPTATVPTGNVMTNVDHAFPVTGADETYAVSLDNTGATSQFAAWRFDGTTWAQIGSSSGVKVIPAPDAVVPLRIGGSTGTGNIPVDIFQGRIYNVEMRSGLNPAAGTVLWRFDATEVPGDNLSYTDPRGRTWTLTSLAAIAH